jgi:hypothetical protein
VPVGATGAWSGHAGQLAKWDEDGGGWAFTTLPVGTIFQVLDTSPPDQQQVVGSGLSSLVDLLVSEKGDLLTHNGSEPVTLPVVDDGDVLVANSSKQTGLQWKSSRDVFTSLVYSKDIQPSTDTVDNSVSEVSFTSISPALLGSDAAPRAGDVIVIKGAGTYGTTGTPTLNLKVKLGTVVLASTGAITMGSSISNRGFSFEVKVTLMSVGAAGTVEAHGCVTFSTASATSALVSLFSTAPIAVDTNVASSVSVTAQWGTASASNTITLRQLYIEYLNIRTSDASVLFVDASGTTIQTSSTTVSETIPLTTSVGDLLLAFIMHRSSATPPSGWTLVASATCTSPLTQSTSVYKRTASSGDAGASVTWTQSSAGRIIAHLNCYRGTLSPADVVAYATTSQNSVDTNILPWANVVATADGQIGVAASSCILAHTGGAATTMSASSGTMSSPASAIDNRMAVARLARNNGQTLGGQFTDNLVSPTGNANASVSVVVG